MNKKILGLDLGTNSIGWALIEQNLETKTGNIIDLGSRIIPMSQDILSEFGQGNTVSQTAERTFNRGVRRLRERHLLRRERLHRVLHILQFLPKHYSAQIDFEKHCGQFIADTEPKLVYDADKHFIFKKSFEEMLADFAKHQPDIVSDGKKIPHDWTIYYLRKKALTEKIEKEELAWLLLNFNQKRGYYQLRGEEEEATNKLIEFHSLVVQDVINSGDKKGNDELWYNVILENGWIYRRTSKTPLEWKGKTKEFIVTTDLNDDGTIKKDKEGKEKRSFRAPSEDDWTLLKKKTEFDIDKSKKTVGAYIYDTLLQNPKQKINGKLVRVVERKFYKDELKQILQTQQKFHTELQDEKLYKECLHELYEYNTSHQNSIKTSGFVYLFLDDIIFYQRPLKSKKSLISDCKFESRTYFLKGERKEKAIKCIAKSHPLFQEFRLWKWIANLNIYNRENDNAVTNEFLDSEEDFVALFNFLNERKEIEQKAVLKYFKLNEKTHRWNYVEDKAYPCNETHSLIIARLAKCENVPLDFLTKEKEEALWHILYSVNDKIDIEKALKTFAAKNNLGNDFFDNFKKIPPFKNEYGAYSAKAIKKLLPLMRMGKYSNEESIDAKTKDRVRKIITAEYDETIKNRVREKALNLTDIKDFKGLPEWLASYIVYDRHAEVGEINFWKKPIDIEFFLKEFRQHSLRNPIVEQVILETLRLLKDIWVTYGNGAENFFDEIHVELGREMKNDKATREKMTTQNTENENTNLRIKALLAELMNDSKIENVRPYSSSQQEILKIYEDGVFNADNNIDEEILKIRKAAQPTQAQLLRYKLWLEQGYVSPYTGEIIPLSKLFTIDYEIEHIIPQSRFFDDSFSNKVICESQVNKLKTNQLGLEFIKNHKGEKVTLNFGKTVEIFSEKNYEEHVNRYFEKSFSKKKKMMLEDIPEKMIERQMNDTRYISKVVKSYLSNIVRKEKNDDGTTSINVLSTNGQITSTLKQDWGLNEVWNEIIAPRFVRLNEMTQSNSFGKINPNINKFLPEIPLEHSKWFSKKRIDHRHHAMDALVIACATRNHINYLNNKNAAEKGKAREDLKHLLCEKKYNEGNDKNYKWQFKKPWKHFTVNAKDQLNTTIVSFKQNLRVINKTVNKIQKWETKKGISQKVTVIQTKGDSWAIRKSLHTPMPYGKRNYSFDILKIAENVDKRELIIDEYIKDKVNETLGQFESKMTATQNYLKSHPILDKNGNSIVSTAFKIPNEKFRKRQPISTLSNRGQGGIKTTEDAVKFINKIADYQIQQSLLNHLKENNNDIDKAFSPDGIELFNSKRKIPVFRLPIAESGDKRFPLGKRMGTKHKWMEATKGTNLFFAIYQNEKQQRLYNTIQLNIVVERQKQGLSSVPENDEHGNKLLFHLSPNDLVYVPTKEEKEDSRLVAFQNLNAEQVKRIYKMVSATGSQCMFIRNDISTSIVNKIEFTSSNKMEKTIESIMIKESCWKLQINRVGKIVAVIKEN